MSKNFATSTVAIPPSPPSSGLTLSVATGHGVRFSAGPMAFWPGGAEATPDNAEIVIVSSVVGDVLTLSSRAAESSTARSVAVGWQIAQGLTAGAFDTLASLVATHSSTLVTLASGLAGAAEDDLSNVDPATGRAALGLGTAATKGTGTTPGTVAAGDDGRITGSAQKSANLSDLASASTARTNLGLGSSAVMSPAQIAADPALSDEFTPSSVIGRHPLTGWYHADQFIAAAGNADPTAAIQQALDAVPAGGATVYVSPGSYAVGGLTVSQASTRLLLDGVTLALRNAANSHLLAVNAASCRIQGGIIDGNKTNQTSNGKGITVASTATGCRIAGTRVINTRLEGIGSLNVNDLEIDGATVIDSNYIGIFVNATTATSGVTVKNCTVDRTSIGTGVVEGGIKVHGAAGQLMRQVSVTGNQVAMPVSPTDATAIGVEVWYAPSASISGNRTAGGAMGMSLAACDASSVATNRVYNAATYGIEFAGCHYATGAGNTVDGNGLTSRGIVGTLGNSLYSDGCTLVGNTVTGCVLGAVRWQGAVGLALTGNFLYGTTSYVVNILSCTGYSIAGNTIDGLGTATKALVLDSSTMGSVAGNTIRNTTQHGILLFSSLTSFVISEIVIGANAFSTVQVPIGSQLSNGATVASTVKMSPNIGEDDFLNVASSVKLAEGAGSPEGVKNAGVGSIYLRRDGGAGTSLYLKETGTGNTGWVAARSNSGVLDAETNGVVAGTNSSGYSQLNTVLAAAAAASIPIVRLTPGHTYDLSGGYVFVPAGVNLDCATATLNGGAFAIVNDGIVSNGVLGTGWILYADHTSYWGSAAQNGTELNTSGTAIIGGTVRNMTTLRSGAFMRPTRRPHNTLARTRHELRRQLLNQKTNILILGDSLGAVGSGSGTHWSDLLFNNTYRATVGADYNIGVIFGGNNTVVTNLSTPGSNAHQFGPAVAALEQVPLSNGDGLDDQVKMAEGWASYPPQLSGYSLAILCVGHNGQPGYAQWAETVVAALRRNGVEVMILTQNPTGPTPDPNYARSGWLFSALAEAYGCALVDTYAVFMREILTGRTTATNLLFDGTHPNQAGWNLYAQAIRDVLLDQAEDGGSTVDLPQRAVLVGNVGSTYVVNTGNVAGCQFTPVAMSAGVTTVTPTATIKHPLSGRRSTLASSAYSVPSGEWVEYSVPDTQDIVVYGEDTGTTAAGSIRTNAGGTTLIGFTAPSSSAGNPYIATTQSTWGGGMTSRNVRIYSTSGTLRLFGVGWLATAKRYQPRNTDGSFKGVTLSGTWAVQTGPWFGVSNIPVTDTLTAYAEWEFIGTGVQFLTVKSPSGGKLRITIDGISVVLLDTYSASSDAMTTFRKLELAYGRHKIRVALESLNASADAGGGATRGSRHLALYDICALDTRMSIDGSDATRPANVI